MYLKRSLASTTTVVAIAAALQVTGMTPATADASGHASCLGLESSTISPSGTSDEFPGGRAELQRLVLQLAKQFGITPGAIVSSVAHLHEGSHAACDEAAD